MLPWGRGRGGDTPHRPLGAKSVCQAKPVKPSQSAAQRVTTLPRIFSFTRPTSLICKGRLHTASRHGCRISNSSSHDHHQVACSMPVRTACPCRESCCSTAVRCCQVLPRCSVSSFQNSGLRSTRLRSAQVCTCLHLSAPVCLFLSLSMYVHRVVGTNVSNCNHAVAGSLLFACTQSFDEPARACESLPSSPGTTSVSTYVRVDSNTGSQRTALVSASRQQPPGPAGACSATATPRTAIRDSTRLHSAHSVHRSQQVPAPNCSQACHVPFTLVISYNPMELSTCQRVMVR